MRSQSPHLAILLHLLRYWRAPIHLPLVRESGYSERKLDDLVDEIDNRFHCKLGAKFARKEGGGEDDKVRSGYSPW